MEDKASPVNRRADPVMFGFDFQINAAIVLMLKNIKSLETIRIEGNYEDIELQLKQKVFKKEAVIFVRYVRI